MAWETDQYTLPKEPIAEVGADVSAYIHSRLLNAVSMANENRKGLAENILVLEATLTDYQKQLAKLNGPPLKQNFIWKSFYLQSEIESLKAKVKEGKKQLSSYQSRDYVVQLIAEMAGRPLAAQEKQDAIFGFITNLTPYPTGLKGGQQIAFAPDRLDTVYAYAGFHRILHPSYFIFSSTIKLYGVELGMDKLGHFLNQGFQYYLQFTASKNAGSSYQQAIQAAVNWGVESELTYYGSWVSGIYSNADLASNYAGLHFYLNLFEPLTIDGVTYPELLKQVAGGNYIFNETPENSAELLLKRFVSAHMNEALTPSSFEYLQYVVIKEAVIERCVDWRGKYPFPTMLLADPKELTVWNGDDYGFRAENTISVLDSCYMAISH